VSLACLPVCHYPCRAILDDGVRYVLRGGSPQGFSKTLHVSLMLFICSCALATSVVTFDLGTVRFLHCYIQIVILGPYPSGLISYFALNE